MADQVQAHFSRTTVATAWDHLYDEKESSKFLNRWFRKGIYRRAEIALAEIKRIPNCRVLDVGCGSGRVAIDFASHCAYLEGIDFSAEMVRMAEELKKAAGVTNCTFHSGNFVEAPAAQYRDRFDVCIALGVLDYIEDPLLFLRRMGESSTQRVVFSVPRWTPRWPLRKIRYWLRGCPVYFYTRRSLEKACFAAGLSNLQIHKGRAGYVVVADTRS